MARSSGRKGLFESFASLLGISMLLAAILFPFRGETLFYLSCACGLLGIYGGIKTRRNLRTEDFSRGRGIVSVSAMTISIFNVALVAGETALRMMKAFLK